MYTQDNVGTISRKAYQCKTEIWRLEFTDGVKDFVTSNAEVKVLLWYNFIGMSLVYQLTLNVPSHTWWLNIYAFINRIVFL